MLQHIPLRRTDIQYMRVENTVLEDNVDQDSIDNLVPDDNTVENMMVWFDNQSQDHEHISNLIHTY